MPQKPLTLTGDIRLAHDPTVFFYFVTLTSSKKKSKLRIGTCNAAKATNARGGYPPRARPDRIFLVCYSDIFKKEIKIKNRDLQCRKSH